MKLWVFSLTLMLAFATTAIAQSNQTIEIWIDTTNGGDNLNRHGAINVFVQKGDTLTFIATNTSDEYRWDIISKKELKIIAEKGKEITIVIKKLKAYSPCDLFLIQKIAGENYVSCIHWEEREPKLVSVEIQLDTSGLQCGIAYCSCNGKTDTLFQKEGKFNLDVNIGDTLKLTSNIFASAKINYCIWQHNWITRRGWIKSETIQIDKNQITMVVKNIDSYYPEITLWHWFSTNDYYEAFLNFF